MTVLSITTSAELSLPALKRVGNTADKYKLMRDQVALKAFPLKNQQLHHLQKGSIFKFQEATYHNSVLGM
jgi:hypothetical protein